jgi:hypothetical protein
VVVTSDHGEEFLEHGGLGHGFTHYQEQLHVPLVFAGPGIRQGVVSTPVSLIDIVPTILEVSGLESPPSVQGLSLAEALRNPRRAPSDRPLYAEGLLRYYGLDPVFYRSLQREDLKLIMDFQRHRKMLFDLGQDPGEMNNVLATRRDTGRSLLEEMIEVNVANADVAGSTSFETVDVSEDLAAELRALGYVGSELDQGIGDIVRQPGRILDLDPLGFMGNERDFGSYVSRIHRDTVPFPEEQLLYGIRPTGGGKSFIMTRRAGARLKREEGQARWRLWGTALEGIGAENPLVVTLRINGGETRTLEVPDPRRVRLNGKLADDEDFVRFDVECNVEAFAGAGRTDDHAPCLRLSLLEVR